MTEQELEQLKADARRYDYLRRKAWYQDIDGGPRSFFGFPFVEALNMSVDIVRQGPYFDYRDSVDAAVDAAIEKQKGK